MLIYELIEFCKEYFDRNKNGKCDNCKKECIGCKECLEEIHKPTGKRHCDCNNACCYYVCHHILRYSSEINYALEICKSVMQSKTELRFCSIGCGPSSELYSIDNYLRTLRFPGKCAFRGFDLSRMWTNMHSFIKNQFPYNVNFEYQNAFDYYAQTEEKPNVIILNYVLSDILKYKHTEGLYLFVDHLYDLFSQCEKDTIIIINDTNIGLSDCHIRYHYDSIERKFNKSSRVLKMHFANSYRAPFAYGKKYNNNLITSVCPDYISNFNPWLECRSAQLIIAKN